MVKRGSSPHLFKLHIPGLYFLLFDKCESNVRLDGEKGGVWVENDYLNIWLCFVVCVCLFTYLCMWKEDKYISKTWQSEYYGGFQGFYLMSQTFNNYLNQWSGIFVFSNISFVSLSFKLSDWFLSCRSGLLSDCPLPQMYEFLLRVFPMTAQLPS